MFVVSSMTGISDKESVITFLYQLVRGKAGRSYGMNVASLANIPADIVKYATQKSQHMEDRELVFRYDVWLCMLN